MVEACGATHKWHQGYCTRPAGHTGDHESLEWSRWPPLGKLPDYRDIPHTDHVIAHPALAETLTDG
jgi:hypothetical protein